MKSEFVGAMLREVYPSVEVWDGSAWQLVGSIVAMGPRVTTDRAVIFNLPETNDGVTRVRVSAMAGLWMIDRAVIDYGPIDHAAASGTSAEPVIPGPGSSPGQALTRDLDSRIRGHDVVVLDASSAIDHTGRDVRALVQETDGEYLIMTEIGNYADLIFDAPSKVDGLERTVVLETSGYYRMHIDPQGPPNPELIHKLATEPGALSHWVLSRLYESREMALATKPL